MRAPLIVSLCLLSLVQPAAAQNPPRLANISTRLQVLTGDDVAIAGFVVGGSAPKTVVVNVAGPSLAGFGIANALADPMLTLVRSSDQSVIATNDDWQTQANPGDFGALNASGFQPADPKEPALIATLAPGAYTAIVQGAGGGTGVALVGVFEVDRPDVPLVNISTRGRVLTGNDVMIAGFIVQGSASQAVVVNVAGPSLNAQGLDGLANPTLTLIQSSDNSVVAQNDDWLAQAPADVASIQASGFQPKNPAEPAIFAILPPGAYTAIVSGAGGGTGVGLVGVFTTDPVANCAKVSRPFSFTSQYYDYGIPKGGSASFKLPAITQSGHHAELIAFQSTNTPSDLQSEVAISSTCGSFDVEPACKQSGSSWSSIDLWAFAVPPSVPYCQLTPGTTYYVNVRNVVDGVDSCKAGTSCTQRLQYIGDLQ